MALLAILQLLFAPAAGISVSPTVVASELPSVVTITGDFVANASGVAGANVVSIKSIDNNYVDRAYSPTGYHTHTHTHTHTRARARAPCLYTALPQFYRSHTRNYLYTHARLGLHSNDCCDATRRRCSAHCVSQQSRT